MAFSETDRTFIRHFLGFSAIFVQADLRLENAITACQSEADGGSRPDPSTENYIKGCIYGFAAVTGTAGVTPGPTSTTGATFSMPAQRGLIQIEAQIAQLDSLLGVLSADNGEAKLDTARERVRLCMEGRRLVNAVARQLATNPRADIFSSAPVNADGDAFYGLPDGTGENYQW